MTIHLLTLLHVLATVVWVGGMFFAHMCLRPAALSTLEPAQRLPLWNAVFGRFFPWVWGCVMALLLTGQAMTAQLGGMGGVPVAVHVMAGIGHLMALIFAYIYFAPYPSVGVDQSGPGPEQHRPDLPAARAGLNRENRR